jgi:hypothetical protein
MADTLALPKPKDQKKQLPEAVHVFRDGREVCNLQTKEGHDKYERNKRVAWERQGHICCLHGFIPQCPGKLNWADATLDHEIPRGHGGGSQDDRIEVEEKQPDGTVKVRWQNGAAHFVCNGLKGSRRINYNAKHNGDIDWELIPKTTRSGKVLYRCPRCGYETPSPTKTHKCTKTGGL